MVKKIKKILLVMALSVFGFQTHAQTTVTPFPYFESFLGGTLPQGVSKATPQGTLNGQPMQNSATPTSEGLRLTNSSGDQFGSVLLDGFTFNNANGIRVEFEYIMRGGTPTPADGISMFLYDAEFDGTIGAEGKGLGYASNRHPQKQRFGVRGGYLMVGLDEFGNAKNQVYGGSQEYMQGLRGAFGASDRSMVTIRGAYDRGRTGDDQFRYGYPVLAAQSTIYKRSGNNGANAGMRLNYTNGNYPTTPDYNISGNTFRVRGGSAFNSENDPGYRKANILLTPLSGGGYNITVSIIYNDGDGLVEEMVYQNLPYPTSIRYPENAEYNSNNAANINSNNIRTLNTTPPEAFKIGFSASTGGYNQVQVVKNLRVTLPYMAEPEDDFTKYCPATAAAPFASIEPFANDVVYKGSIADANVPDGGNDDTHINFSSFLFVDEAGNVLGSDDYTDPDKGKWSYDKNTGLVTFLPKHGFTGEATISYSIKGFGNTVAQGPFGQDVYRSVPKIITVDVINCGGMVNPQLPSGGVSRSDK